MKKTLFVLCLIHGLWGVVYAQSSNLVDSLKLLLKNHEATRIEKNLTSPSLFDSTEANILYELSRISWANNRGKIKAKNKGEVDMYFVSR